MWYFLERNLQRKKLIDDMLQTPIFQINYLRNQSYFISLKLKLIQVQFSQFSKKSKLIIKNKIKLKINISLDRNNKAPINFMAFNLEQDSLRISQLVQDYHPMIRRRAVTSIRASFPTFFSSEIQTNAVSMHESQKLITEQYNKIHHIIDLVDDHIRRKIQCYENEVVSVVQKQIDQMRQETYNVVEQFNSMIEQKNKENQIWSLNNELDYFKSQAKKLFDQNKLLKKQNLQAKRKAQQYEWQLENRQVIMQKLLYKYQKEKYHKEKIKSTVNSKMEIIQKEAEEKRKISRPQILEFSLKQDALDMPQIRLDMIKPINPRKQTNLPSAKISEKNSLLVIDYEEDFQSSQISINAKSINLTSFKPQVKDQSCQANIYLSQHRYKNLFEKKQNRKRYTHQIAIQTDSDGDKACKIPQNETTNSSPKKNRDINFTKNGFYLNEVNNKKPHYRSTSSNFNRYKGQSSGNLKENENKRYTNLATEPNFNKNPDNQEAEYILGANKSFKLKNKFHSKMVTKFQQSKIVGKAYSRNKLNKSFAH